MSANGDHRMVRVTEERSIRQVRDLLLKHNPETIPVLRLRFGFAAIKKLHWSVLSGYAGS
jgi:hypothetical protein